MDRSVNLLFQNQSQDLANTRISYYFRCNESNETRTCKYRRKTIENMTHGSLVPSFISFGQKCKSASIRLGGPCQHHGHITHPSQALRRTCENKLHRASDVLKAKRCVSTGEKQRTSGTLQSFSPSCILCTSKCNKWRGKYVNWKYMLHSKFTPLMFTVGMYQMH